MKKRDFSNTMNTTDSKSAQSPKDKKDIGESVRTHDISNLKTEQFRPKQWKMKESLKFMDADRTPPPHSGYHKRQLAEVLNWNLIFIKTFITQGEEGGVTEMICSDSNGIFTKPKFLWKMCGLIFCPLLDNIIANYAYWTCMKWK